MYSAYSVYFSILTYQSCPLPLTGTNSSQHSSSADDVRQDSDGLYPGHIPTNLFQKVLLSVGFSALALTCPWRRGMSIHRLRSFLQHLSISDMKAVLELPAWVVSWVLTTIQVKFICSGLERSHWRPSYVSVKYYSPLIFRERYRLNAPSW